MSAAASAGEDGSADAGFPALARRLAFWSFVALLAWAPFPLGSNRPWSWSLLVILIAACWLLWAVSVWRAPEAEWRYVKPLLPALILAGAALCWAAVQILPVVPEDWSHPVWAMASGALGHPLPAAISIDPWRTATESMKLAAYIAACWLAYALSRRSEWATRLLDAMIFIGAAYAAYAVALRIAGIQQIQLFYQTRPPYDQLTGPFVLHNSYATYAGMAFVAALARLFAKGAAVVVHQRGVRRLALSTLQFAFGAGAPFLLAALLTFSTLVDAASRGGFFATMCALAVVAVVASLAAPPRARAWLAVAELAIAGLLWALFVLNGASLGARMDAMVDAGGLDEGRRVLWAAAARMIDGAPFLGLGLGTFQDAYPLYAGRVLPFIMDKAHCDYLEFAAGLGLPAAAAWWAALLWVFALVLRGALVRRRNRVFPLIGAGAMVLVAVHSAVDFSLQIPAVALAFAAFTGIGLAQSFRTKS